MGHETVHAAQQASGHGNHGTHEAAVASTCASGADCGHEHGSGCSACGICHSALSHPHLPVPPQAQAPSALRPHGGARFASAPAALAIKPPIS